MYQKFHSCIIYILHSILSSGNCIMIIHHNSGVLFYYKIENLAFIVQDSFYVPNIQFYRQGRSNF